MYTIVVGCTKSEPEPGWLDNNMNGVTGVIAPLIVGFLRTIQLSKDKIADIVPVDYASNALICVMWDTVNRYSRIDIITLTLHYLYLQCR